MKDAIISATVYGLNTVCFVFQQKKKERLLHVGATGCTMPMV
jgi:hypothetical protein